MKFYIIALLLPLVTAKDCTTIKVVSGDSCSSLANKCKIPGNKFEQYNPGVCGSLVPGQLVCCTEGTLPNIKPKPLPNGDCFNYKVKSGEWCGKIASENGLKVEEIEAFNKKTYGWWGCEGLGVNQVICLSTGKAPKPTPNPKAECGPLALGDKYDSECPNKECCSDYGYCGTTSEFCEKSESPTGAPGTEGCYSNCWKA